MWESRVLTVPLGAMTNGQFLLPEKHRMIACVFFVVLVSLCLVAYRIWSLMGSLLFYKGAKQQETICIVGASWTGLALAEKLATQLPGCSVVLLEASSDSYGIWASAANNKSQLQIEHYIYCDLDTLPDCSSSYPSVYEIQSFLARKARKLQTFPNVEIRYGCKVTGLVESGPSSVQVQYTDYNLVPKGLSQSQDFSSVHIRTGSLSRPRSIDIPGLDRHYAGRWAHGISNNLDTLPVRGSRVVIIGMGAFAVENAKRAIELGASKVTFVSRSPKACPSPRFLMHHGTVSLLQLANVVLSKETDARWNEIIEALRLSPKKEASKDSPDGYDMAASAIVPYMGKDHFMFTSSAQSDWFYAALSMDAIEIVRGRVVEASSPDTLLVKTEKSSSSPSTLQADVVLACIGHNCDTSLLFNIPLSGTIFGMNGKLTHNLRVDLMPNPTLFGPRCAVPLFPVLSYGLVCDVLDQLTLCSIRDKSFYKKWCWATKSHQYPQQCFVENIDGRDWIQLCWNCLCKGFPQVACPLLGILYDRYQACCQLEATGRGWYSTVLSDWEGYIESLSNWRKEQCLPEHPHKVVPYPWCQPPNALRPPRHCRRFYQLMYVCLCVVGVEFLVQCLSHLPWLQVVVKMLL